MRSLRTTLLLTLLAAVTVVTAAAAILVDRLAHKEIDELLDYHLRQIALSLRDKTQAGPLELAGDDVDGPFEFVVQMRSRDGATLYESHPGFHLPAVSEIGFSTVRREAEVWRVYAAELGGRRIEVAQPLRIRERLAFRAASRTLAPVLLVLPVLALLVWRLVGRALAPLDRLATSVGARTPAALDAFPEAGVVREALPLVRSLNGLLNRLASALAQQRSFIADAAHHLRTPLAVLRLQAQLVEQACDDEERAAALGELRTAIDREAHVVHQILTLAREEPEAAVARRLAPMPLADVAREVAGDHVLLAEAKGVDLGVVQAADEAVMLGDPASMRVMLVNLVTNAIRYAPRGGRVDVTVGTSAASGTAYVEIADDGPGIPEPERERVFDRFYRLAGASGSGSGLGLAIVKSIVDRHEGRVTLRETPGGGLTVRVEFPLLRSWTLPDAEPRRGTTAEAGSRAWRTEQVGVRAVGE